MGSRVVRACTQSLTSWRIATVPLPVQCRNCCRLQSNTSYPAIRSSPLSLPQLGRERARMLMTTSHFVFALSCCCFPRIHSMHSVHVQNSIAITLQSTQFSPCVGCPQGRACSGNRAGLGFHLLHVMMEVGHHKRAFFSFLFYKTTTCTSYIIANFLTQTLESPNNLTVSSASTFSERSFAALGSVAPLHQDPWSCLLPNSK